MVFTSGVKGWRVPTHALDKRKGGAPNFVLGSQETWSAAFFAAGHYGGVQAFTEAGGHVVNLVGAIDLDGLAGGVEGDLAVIATLQVFLEVRSHLGGYRVVDQIVEQGEELSARHFSTPFFRLK